MPGFGFPKSARLRKPAEFDAAYKRGLCKRLGPIMIHAVLNGAERSRLGMSVPRRVGNAVRRNRIKRRLREAFRTSEMPPGLDLVVTVRRHDPLTVAEYRTLLTDAAVGLSKRLGRGVPSSD